MARRWAFRLLLLCAALVPLIDLRGQSPAGSSSPAIAPAPDTAPLVVLVHGMGRTSLSMLPLQLALQRSGYRVLNFHYSSYGPSVPRIAAALARSIDAELNARPASRVHFVGHSLGNIVVRWLLVHDPPNREIGRFVMLAPPNRGSTVADRLSPYIGWLLAPISELRTDSGTAVELPPPWGIEFAIIAGGKDRKVRIAETCLTGATAFAVVPSGHTFIPMRPDVIAMTRRFLADGVLPGHRPGPRSSGGIERSAQVPSSTMKPQR
ncbi:MAG: alpha/beta fold hydrolase [Gemmatimonadetes bacterium]|nr:alpha/beta fold hydrolase [Gemmatimonadota bacterium]